MGKEYQHTHTQSSQRRLGCVKHKGSICSCALWACWKKKKRRPSLTSHINTHKCKRGAVKILFTWQTDMLCRKKKLLSGSAAAKPCLGAKSHSSIFFPTRGIHHAALLVLFLPQYYCTVSQHGERPIHRFTGRLWDPYGPKSNFYLLLNYFLQKLFAWTYL